MTENEAQAALHQSTEEALAFWRSHERIRGNAQLSPEKLAGDQNSAHPNEDGDWRETLRATLTVAGLVSVALGLAALFLQFATGVAEFHTAAMALPDDSNRVVKCRQDISGRSACVASTPRLQTQAASPSDTPTRQVETDALAFAIDRLGILEDLPTPRVVHLSHSRLEEVCGRASSTLQGCFSARASRVAIDEALLNDPNELRVVLVHEMAHYAMHASGVAEALACEHEEARALGAGNAMVRSIAAADPDYEAYMHLRIDIFFEGAIKNACGGE